MKPPARPSNCWKPSTATSPPHVPAAGPARLGRGPAGHPQRPGPARGLHPAALPQPGRAAAGRRGRFHRRREVDPRQRARRARRHPRRRHPAHHAPAHPAAPPRRRALVRGPAGPAEPEPDPRHGEPRAAARQPGRPHPGRLPRSPRWCWSPTRRCRRESRCWTLPTSTRSPPTTASSPGSCWLPPTCGCSSPPPTAMPTPSRGGCCWTPPPGTSWWPWSWTGCRPAAEAEVSADLQSHAQQGRPGRGPAVRRPRGGPGRDGDAPARRRGAVAALAAGTRRGRRRARRHRPPDAQRDRQGPGEPRRGGGEGRRRPGTRGRGPRRGRPGRLPRRRGQDPRGHPGRRPAAGRGPGPLAGLRGHGRVLPGHGAEHRPLPRPGRRVLPGRTGAGGAGRDGDRNRPAGRHRR